ncbi:MAG: homocysteine S-methyltransferase family protein [Clostridium sp.]|nr:homocysteine S-methyltransferase family protein [Clostridium sp.]
MGILEELKKRILVFDGGMGSLLQAAGLGPGELPETWNLLHPEVVRKIHLDYLEAGSDIVNTNTFGANRLKYGEKLSEIVQAAAENARWAVREAGHGYVALDLGPTGRLLKPMGDLDFEEAVDIYAEVVREGVRCGVDLILIETMSDLYELKAAVLAAKENSELPVMATVIFDAGGKLLTGGTPRAAVALLEGLRVDALGLNCGLGPVQMLPMAKELVKYASVPVIVTPNAGLPRSENGKTVYDIGPEEFAASMRDILDLGVSMVGGCCGTTPAHIAALHEVVAGYSAPQLTEKPYSLVTSFAGAVEFGKDPILIGERINPTGKSRFKQALRERDMEYILSEGLAQQDAGAHILDVNVGLPGIDEAQMMEDVVRELQSVTELPLQIDTSDVRALERALRIYNGKPLINSVNGKKESMDAVFPLAAKYGGVIVALTLDEDGIPQTADGRIAIAEKIYKEAEKYGIRRKDILIDALCLTISSEAEGAITTLETVRRIHDEYGGGTILGVSNISFGLPKREYVNSVFFTMAMQKGLSAAIINPGNAAMMRSYYGFRALMALDEHCGDYIRIYSEEAAREKEARKAAESTVKAGGPGGGTTAGNIPGSVPGNSGAPGGGASAGNSQGSGTPGNARDSAGNSPGSGLMRSVERGLKDQAAKAAGEVLSAEAPLEVINRYMIPALDKVGKRFEEGTLYLPQLLMSADAAKAAFDVIKGKLGDTGKDAAKKGTIILATVKGDIHDIGKNIVKVLLENYSFEVVDLGRDVAPERIVKAAVDGHISLVGLSALMTTTVPGMEETIKKLRKEAPWVKIMVGGAVLTEDYAMEIGADAYCRDGMASVNYAQKVFGQVN